MPAMTTALRKNLLALLAITIGVLLYFLYRGLFPTPSTAPLPLDPLSIWQLPPPANANDTAGYPSINATHIQHIEIFHATNSTPFSGTFNHHPHVLTVNGSSSLVLVSWSNGLVDEDADGQQVLYRLSTDGGYTFTMPAILFPAALNYSQLPSRYDPTRLQRALCSEGFIQMDGRTFALAELFGQSDVTGIPREGQGMKATGFGRVAQEINSTDGRPIGQPCWLQPSRFAAALAGTPYDPSDRVKGQLCDDADILVPLLSYGSNQPAWAWSVLSDSHHVHAANASTDVTEPTHAVVFNATSICRFWRLRSPAVNRTQYIECTNASMADTTYNTWYNGTDELARGWYGPYPGIVASNIPDAGSKAFLGAFPASSANARSTYLSWQSPANLTHYLIHNPKTSGHRWPLTISTSTDNSTFTAIAALHPTAPTATRYPDPTKNAGYFYPAASILQSTAVNGTSSDALLVVYTLNKEDIWLSRVQVTHLPRWVPATVGGGPSDAFGKGFVFFVLCVLAVAVIGGLVWKLVYAPLSEDEEEEVVKGKELSHNGWVDKRVPLSTAGGDEYYENGEEEDGEEYEDEEDEEEEEDEEAERKMAPTSIVTSTDVAHLVGAPRVVPASAPARARKV